ncbi:hypothetical protein QNH10_13465 [Sporosarcina thermotolerans]|uniref:hypothetical protein n=1 Tax=Sporosarcina thermotolerans TaxID=633404 RepID=UPI0024BD08CE|nr:hypothetical protein [Sporosarcina thermotolerans]WHT47232.1 hypothetical protein QNH10_13465 [Sporosarcina thermotolerans]
MVKLNRFIQFNDETIDANQLLLYERLGRALADAPYLELTERKLFELQPKEGGISLSVFWRHRPEEITHMGRLSDVYLMTAGFWKNFSVSDWLKFRQQYERHHLRKFAEELLLMLEEFRLMDLVEKQRPGTSRAFSVRRQLLLQFHYDRLVSNFKKGFYADALMDQLFITLHDSMFAQSTVEWELPIEQIHLIASYATDATSTSQMMNVVDRIIFMIEEVIEQDLIHQYYAIGDSISEETAAFHFHDGMKEAEKGSRKSKKQLTRCSAHGIGKMKVSLASILNMNLNMAERVGETAATWQKEMKMPKSKKPGLVNQRATKAGNGPMKSMNKLTRKLRRKKPGKNSGKSMRM